MVRGLQHPATPPRSKHRQVAPETPGSLQKRLEGLWQGGCWWCELPLRLPCARVKGMLTLAAR